MTKAELMNERNKNLDALIRILLDMDDEYGTSCENDMEVPEPIEIGSALHKAVQAVESAYPNGKLPLKVRTLPSVPADPTK